MKEAIKQELLFDLTKTIEILEVKEEKDIEELKELSDHAIEDVAVHKDLDLISITVLLYSIYKIIHNLKEEDCLDLVEELKNAKKQLEQNNLGRYNASIKALYQIVHKSSVEVKEHLQDVMHAARIKKGTTLLQKGLSIGQAAGLMGLSNWDLQQYAGHTTALAHHSEIIPARKRLLAAFNLITKNAKINGDKIIFFDTGPIISLVMSRLVWILPHLKKQFGGKFYITPAVHKELIERPLTVRRFEFEALQTLKLIKEGILEVYNQVPAQKAVQLETLANNSFKIESKTIDLVQSGELESVACALELGAAAVVMDERTLRLFIENSSEMVHLLEERFNKKVTFDALKIKQFSQQFSNLTIIRSVELISVAYKIGLLDSYLPDQKQSREILIDSVLWGAKYNGCAVTENEINELKQFLLKS